MRVYLAGGNGKQQILQLYEDVLGKRNNKDATVLEAVWDDRQTDRQTEARNENLLSRRNKRKSQSVLCLNKWGGMI